MSNPCVFEGFTSSHLVCGKASINRIRLSAPDPLQNLPGASPAVSKRARLPGHLPVTAASVSTRYTNTVVNQMSVFLLFPLHTSAYSDFCIAIVREEELYAFLYNPHQNEDDRRRGWELIDVSNDFRRMGLSNEHWEISHLNKNYEVATSRVSTIL